MESKPWDTDNDELTKNPDGSISGTEVDYPPDKWTADDQFSPTDADGGSTINQTFDIDFVEEEQFDEYGNKIETKKENKNNGIARNSNEFHINKYTLPEILDTPASELLGSKECLGSFIDNYIDGFIPGLLVGTTTGIFGSLTNSNVFLSKKDIVLHSFKTGAYFGLFFTTFATTKCMMKVYRKKEDKLNVFVGGFVAGVVSSVKYGARPAFVSGVVTGLASTFLYH